MTTGPLAGTIGDHGTVEDDLLSQAVVAYAWGNPRLPWPGRRPDAVRELAGDQAEHLLNRITGLLAEAAQVPTCSDLAAYGTRIEEKLRLTHPDLSDEAREAISGIFTYAWR